MSKHNREGVRRFMWLFLGVNLVLQGFSLVQPVHAIPFPPDPEFCEEGFQHLNFDTEWQQLYDEFCGGDNDNGNPGPVCGNGIKESGEQCDGADLDGVACMPEYDGGELTCTDECRFDFNQCFNGLPECGNGVIEHGESCDDGALNGEPNQCDRRCTGITPPVPVTIVAHKIVCENETYLPNWGEAGVPDITAATASDFVSASEGHCRLEPDWTFQWGFGDKEEAPGVDKLNGAHIGEADGTDSSGLCSAPWCGPNTYTGSAYGEWKTFGPTDQDGTTAVFVEDLEGASLIWVRENLKEGYIPFTYPPQGPAENNVSAEIYCGTDTLNYDNYDYISGLQAGGTYHCVAFNAPIQSQEEPFCGDGEVNQESEQCDDGNDIDDDACSNQCQVNEPEGPVCGNSTVEEGEQCDDGNTTSEDGCSAACQNEGGESEEPFCGDGTVDEGEQCDDGNDIDDDACSNQCLLNESEPPVCGNTVVESGEQCDDGNTIAGDGCNSLCQTETPPGGGGPTGSASSGGGGGGGGGIVGLSVFNEANDSVTLPNAIVSWFTNINATCHAVYDTISHDGTGASPSYGYVYSVTENVAGGTFHTATLTGLNLGTQYFWRPVCTGGGQERIGRELSIATVENPSVLGFSEGSGAAAPVENVKVLGFEHLPDTGGDLRRYFTVVTMLAALILTLTSLGYLLTLRKNL